jgi:ATP-dependent DNA helicase RecG
MKVNYLKLKKSMLISILKTEEIFNKIRNLNYRYIINDSLFPLEIKMYDPYVIREALHNCIAHQDYTLNSRITVVEEKDKLIFKNAGSFLPKTIENVIDSDAPQDFYRNNFLTRAMVNLNMIDTIGSGIKKMFETQQKRFFPLPEYNFSNNSVKVTIYGKILDENYTKLLMKKIDLNLKTIILLDKVQKNENLDNSDYKYLRKLKMIEGRRPNVHISKKIAEATGDKVNYIKRKALDNDYYEKIIISFLKEFNKASRKELEAILFDKFSDSLNESQKIYKVKNLLTKMKKENKIKIIGAGKYSEWILND